MMENGEWRPTRAESPSGTIGYHLSGLYSPVGWLSWSDIAQMWEAAQATDEGKRSFKNGVLGETWIESGEAPDWQRIYERRSANRLGIVPSCGLFLTAGADLQKDRIEVSVWAWGRGLASWLVDHIVIPGGPASADAWADMTALLDRTWPHAHGARLSIVKLAVDTGFETAAVYAWARAQGSAQIAAIKGVEGFNRVSPVTGPTFVDATEAGRKIRRGARLWTVAVSTFKSETYRFLRLSLPTDDERTEGAVEPAGTISLPQGVDAEWIKQLVAEHLITVTTKRGFRKLEWQKMRERNEALDCRVYARAAAWIVGADRWTDEKWRDLEDQIGPLPADGNREVGEPAGRLTRPPGPATKRSSDWLGPRKKWL
jgi:phage terminase large subunit GpA-like protein